MGELMDHVLQGAQLPETWTEGLVRVVPKVPGSLLVSDMRPICLQNMSIKWMTAIVLRQLEDFLAAVIPRSQKGCVKGRQMTDHITQATNTWHERHPGAWLSLDFSKAFDSVSHEYWP